MKSVTCSIVLIASLSVGHSVFAQGRGRTGGPPVGQSHPGPAAADHGSGRPSGVGAANRPGHATDHDANANANTQNGQAPNNRGKRISDHPALASNLQGLLPNGTNMDTASSGFKNMGQFVAAVHVSNNLDIPFDQLKTKMVTDRMPLGEAIRSLKPDMSKSAASTEARKAEGQAKKDTNSKS